MKLTSFSLLLASTCYVVSAAEAPIPGLLVAYSKPTHPELTDEAFNKWYDEEHITAFVKCGIADLVLRYRNVNATATYPYLALYRLPDIAKMNDGAAFSCIPINSQLLPGPTKGSKGGAYTDIMDLDLQTYKRTQSFEAQVMKVGRARGISTAAMEPAAGTDAEFDDWYKKQHLDMLSMLRGYRRSTRFFKDAAPKYLAIHEFDSTTVPPEIGLVLGTEWSKKILKGAKSSFNTWKYVSEHGKGPTGERF